MYDQVGRDAEASAIGTLRSDGRTQRQPAVFSRAPALYPWPTILGPDPAAMNHLRILVVEDEGLVAMLMEDMLDDLGCEVVCSASNVAQALKWITEDGEADAALLDVNLGGETVWPVADALTARGVRFAFTTGYGQLNEPRFQHAPLLGKPIKGDRLKEVLRGWGYEE